MDSYAMNSPALQALSASASFSPMLMSQLNAGDEPEDLHLGKPLGTCVSTTHTLNPRMTILVRP
jgi:hypothetical protein